MGNVRINDRALRLGRPLGLAVALGRPFAFGTAVG
jgi:hypothetical protein